ncbi:MAG: calcium/sodium antiporter [Agathobacter sp.]
MTEILNLIIQVSLLAIGFLMLVKGADYFVDGAAGIATKFGIPQLVVGLTIVAMGTSAPEAAVSITGAMSGAADIAVGNVVGSNILNIFIILGITGVITSVAVQKSTLFIEIPFMLVVTAVLIVLGITGNEITFIEGIIFWGLFIVYLVYLYVLAKKGAEEKATEERAAWKLFLFIFVGGAVVVLGANISVNAATSIASTIGISEKFIGLTIVALGTSLPELVASVTAARKGNADIAIGNIVGSNIFNILFVLGTSALIIPIPYQASFLVDTLVAVAAGILLWLVTIKNKALGRKGGIIMLICYAVYLAYLLVLQ